MPVAELHRAVTEGATDHVAAVAATRPAVVGERPAGPGPLDIAIVGMACVMPGANDLERFWSNIVDGVSSVTEVPADRWDVDTFFDPDYDHATAHKDPRVMSASKWGGFIDPVEFDALAYGIPPGSLGAIEPNQLLSLKMADDALADAGYGHGGFDRARTAVVYAVTGGTDQASAYSLRATLPAFVGDLPPELDRFLPAITEDSFPGMLPSVVAGRVTNRLDLGGKNLVVDAACASGLAALDITRSQLGVALSTVTAVGGVLSMGAGRITDAVGGRRTLRSAFTTRASAGRRAVGIRALFRNGLRPAGYGNWALRLSAAAVTSTGATAGAPA